jgi:hypothetical protein
LFRKLVGRVVEIVHQLESGLVYITVLEQVPDPLRFRFCQGVVEDIPPDQNYRFFKKELREEGENAVGGRV